MSKTIWKYTLPRDGQTIEIHEYIVEVLHIAAQDGVPTLWAIVDPDRPRDGYTEIVAWGTGWPLPDDVYQECDYWGSCEDWQGYIWHYFAEARFPERVYTEDFVNKALFERTERVKKYDTKYAEMIKNNSLLINTSGHKVGEINGLTIMQIGGGSYEYKY